MRWTPLKFFAVAEFTRMLGFKMNKKLTDDILTVAMALKIEAREQTDAQGRLGIGLAPERQGDFVLAVWVDNAQSALEVFATCVRSGT